MFFGHFFLFDNIFRNLVSNISFFLLGEADSSRDSKIIFVFQILTQRPDLIKLGRILKFTSSCFPGWVEVVVWRQGPGRDWCRVREAVSSYRHRRQVKVITLMLCVMKIMPKVLKLTGLVPLSTYPHLGNYLSSQTIETILTTVILYFKYFESMYRYIK